MEAKNPNDQLEVIAAERQLKATEALALEKNNKLAIARLEELKTWFKSLADGASLVEEVPNVGRLTVSAASKGGEYKGQGIERSIDWTKYELLDHKTKKRLVELGVIDVKTVQLYSNPAPAGVRFYHNA